MDEKANAGMDVNKAVEEVSGYLEVILKEKQRETIERFLMSDAYSVTLTYLHSFVASQK